MSDDQPKHPFEFGFRSDIDGCKSLVIGSHHDMTGWRIETEWTARTSTGVRHIREVDEFKQDTSVPHIGDVPWSIVFDFPEQRIIRWIPPGED